MSWEQRLPPPPPTPAHPFFSQVQLIGKAEFSFQFTLSFNFLQPLSQVLFPWKSTFWIPLWLIFPEFQCCCCFFFSPQIYNSKVISASRESRAMMTGFLKLFLFWWRVAFEDIKSYSQHVSLLYLVTVLGKVEAMPSFFKKKEKNHYLCSSLLLWIFC